MPAMFRAPFARSGDVLLGHQGGWDEILLIAGPMVAIAALLVVAKRRVDASAAQHERQDGD
ncbi:MAG: hypothetical protein AAFP84_04230 [Actinomycetota bacterium]